MAASRLWSSANATVPSRVELHSVIATKLLTIDSPFLKWTLVTRRWPRFTKCAGKSMLSGSERRETELVPKGLPSSVSRTQRPRQVCRPSLPKLYHGVSDADGPVRRLRNPDPQPSRTLLTSHPALRRGSVSRRAPQAKAPPCQEDQRGAGPSVGALRASLSAQTPAKKREPSATIGEKTRPVFIRPPENQPRYSTRLLGPNGGTPGNCGIPPYLLIRAKR